MSALGDACIAAGLPVLQADEVRVMFTRELTATEDETYLNILFPFRQAQMVRKANAINGALLAEQFKTATSQQAVDYVVQQITNGTSEVQALTIFDNAATFAAAKPILRNMLIAIYRIVDILKLMTRILIALRDEVLSGLPEK